MQPNNNDIKRLASPAAVVAATTAWGTYALILAVAGVIFLAVWYFGGDRFTSTPTMGGANGKAPAETPVPAK
jgi:hypothetical protein